ncbi:MAG TPA: hypothetical protein VME23_21385, partial [Terracidiphilus sp.]|nr:hypothetical protein [Terracidiphilus sp.]
TKFEPMNPAPPVTRIVLVALALQAIRTMIQTLAARTAGPVPHSAPNEVLRRHDFFVILKIVQFRVRPGCSEPTFSEQKNCDLLCRNRSPIVSLTILDALINRTIFA